jgi:hypothetical protein
MRFTIFVGLTSLLLGQASCKTEGGFKTITPSRSGCKVTLAPSVVSSPCVQPNASFPRATCDSPRREEASPNDDRDPGRRQTRRRGAKVTGGADLEGVEPRKDRIGKGRWY